MNEPHYPRPPQLTDEQKKAQRARNLAIAWALVTFAVILGLATYFKLGANVLNRPF